MYSSENYVKFCLYIQSSPNLLYILISLSISSAQQSKNVSKSVRIGFAGQCNVVVTNLFSMQDIDTIAVSSVSSSNIESVIKKELVRHQEFIKASSISLPLIPSKWKKFCKCANVQLLPLTTTISCILRI